MFASEIDGLLRQHLPALPTLVCGASLKHDIDELAAMALPVRSLLVVDDARTAQAFGDRVARALASRFACTRLTLSGHPAADDETAARVERAAAKADALAAVGGGTINDLCKYAAFRLGKPYIVFPTSASMNGYLSANASIAVKGYKTTQAARMPSGAFCDLSVIAAAPPRLNKSGLGDCLARPTAQADWLLSHLLLNTPYDDTPFALLAALEPSLLDGARGIAKGDPASIETLMHTLLLSGLGMTIAGGSHPASQGEHMIAHAMHMRKEFRVQSSEFRETFHGEEIGVTALTMARRQEAMLRGPPALNRRAFDEARMSALFVPGAVTGAKEAFARKQALMEKAALSDWEGVAGKIAAVAMQPERIQAVLKAADAPYAPETLRWNPAEYEETAACARFLRDRFTFLDLDLIA